MEESGFRKMISEMAEPVLSRRRVRGAAPTVGHPPEPAAAAAPPIPEDVTSVGSDLGLDATPTPPDTGPPSRPAETTSPPVPSAPPPLEEVSASTVRVPSRFLQIETWEQSAMATLYPLIPSPRAAKRFVNVYRLLRATLTAEEFDDFVREEGGNYRVVLLLHAVITGHPVAATEVVRQLVESTGDQQWWEFVKGFRSRSVVPAGASATARMEGERWRALADDLDRVQGAFADVGSITRFRRWAPRVARYSFQSGRVVVSRAPTGTSIMRPVRARGPGKGVSVASSSDPA
jgi:hypothetical protein